MVMENAIRIPGDERGDMFRDKWYRVQMEAFNNPPSLRQWEYFKERFGDRYVTPRPVAH